MNKDKLNKIEQCADYICATVLVSKHSREYREVVLYISDLFGYRQHIKFDINNRIYVNEGDNE